MEPGTLIFLCLVGFLGFGLLWFHALRPMLEAFGLLGAGEYTVSSVSIMSNGNISADEEADEQTNNQTDEGSAIYDAIAYLQVDRTRIAIIDTLVRAEWSVDMIRKHLKGDTTIVTAEIAEAKRRLGITLSERTLTVSDNGQKREIAF